MDEYVNFDVESRTIYRAIHGSIAYGLATPASDVDVKGVCIEPLNYHFSDVFRFEQQERMANKGHDCDSVIYSLKKFARLAMDANPNILEILYVDEKCIQYIDEFGQCLRNNRELFLSKKTRFTWAGYAHSQVKRMETHRRWLLNPPSHKPTRAEYELQEQPEIPSGQLQTAQAMVTKHLDRWQFNDMSGIDNSIRQMIQETIAELLAEAMVSSDYRYEAACRRLGFDENFLELLAKERKHKQANDEWNSYQSWLKTRNEKRSAGERKFGYDLKNGSHALRLSRMCKEILDDKGVLVDRRGIDAEELIAIKMHGAMKYDDLLDEIKRLNDECTELYKTSTLQHQPDVKKIDDLITDITSRYLARNG